MFMLLVRLLVNSGLLVKFFEESKIICRFSSMHGEEVGAPSPCIVQRSIVFNFNRPFFSGLPKNVTKVSVLEVPSSSGVP